MRLATLETTRGPRAHVLRDGVYYDVNDWSPELSSDALALIASGQLDKAAQAQGRGVSAALALHLPPVLAPQKVLCLGLNYRDHAEESKMAVPEEPVLFNKFPSALVGHDAPIVLPKASDQVDYEAELVAVIGAKARRVAPERALQHVVGYMVGHDVSARDWQLNKPGRQWLAGKTFDTFAPVGPVLVTADEVPDPHALGIRLRLNGETMQDSNTRELIFRLDEVIAYASRIFTLLPGDLVFTGTPAGVGMARSPKVFLKPGDVVEVEIDRIGTLRNPCVAEDG